MATFPWYNPTPSWIEVTSINPYKDNSILKFDSLYDNNTKNIIKKFTNITKPNTVFESFEEFKKAGEPVHATVRLIQSDFTNGTVRLRQSAYYVLNEHIVFEPNSHADFLPTLSQTEGGAMAEYPIAPYGPYSLGFFAAITLEGENIMLDLNGFSIQQSQLFNLQQRFYAHIEVSSSPFIFKQGPGNFGPEVVPAKNSYICNGYLGLSSHHGIHGNDADNLLIQNLVISNFEVAGISLSGLKNSLIRNITICGMSQNIKVMSTYSAARFIRSFVKKIIGNSDGPVIQLPQGSKTGKELLQSLEEEMETVVQDVKDGKKVSSTLFGNPTGLYDAGGYGISLNARGVVIGPFAENREGKIGNTNNIVHDVRVESLAVGPGEVIGVCNCDNKPEKVAYGAKTQVGTAGEIFRIWDVQDENGKYNGDVLSDLQIYVAKFGVGKDQRGTTSIDENLIKWATDGTNIKDVLKNNDLYYVSGNDSMGHTMKGLIAYFISAAENLKLWDLSAKNAKNFTPQGVENNDGDDNTVKIIPRVPIYNGAATRGLAITGSNKVFVKNICIEDLYSEAGPCCAVDIIGECKDIRCRDKISRSMLLSNPSGNIYKDPNPHPATFLGAISSKSVNIQLG